MYGGTERVVHYLTEQLVEQGHEVTLFASADSHTRARLVPGCPRALRLAGAMDGEFDAHSAMLREVHARRHEFDVVHIHVDDWHLREPRLFAVPHVTTVHGRIDIPERLRCFSGHDRLALVSISDAQRAPLPKAPWLGTVHHGLPTNLYTPRYEPGSYLVFLGRISPEKGVQRAIEIAGRFGMKLVIAAKIEQIDYQYYLSIRSELRRPWVDFVGEVDQVQKDDLLGGAYALLFPIDWPEPFGLVMIEAMSCGTPVVAFRNGSTPEIVDHGVSGFLADDVESALSGLRQVATLNRMRVASVARQRFSAPRMATEYLKLYERRRRQRDSLRHFTARVGHAEPRK
jgi:glycosyltransferase involved in cell wall biosynthesis